jgi:hypothetical protein
MMVSKLVLFALFALAGITAAYGPVDSLLE